MGSRLKGAFEVPGGGTGNSQGAPFGTPPPPPKDRGMSSDRDGYQSAQSVSPGDPRSDPRRPPSEGQILQTPLFDAVTYGRLRDLPQ